MRASLVSRGIYVDDGWVSDAMQAAKTETELFVQFLHADLRLAAKESGHLPADISSWQEGVLAGRHVLQLEAIENIGDESARKDSRTLKLLLTDGTADVAAFERRPLEDLSEKTTLGAKLFLQDTIVRRGLLLLEPSNARFLGGGVEVGKKEDVKQHKERQPQPSTLAPQQAPLPLPPRPLPPKPPKQQPPPAPVVATTTAQALPNARPPPRVSSSVALAYDDDDHQEVVLLSPPRERQKRQREYLLLCDFEAQTAPVVSTVWAFVATLRKYFWSSREKRYVLIVALQDASATIDAVFAEIELARLFESPSAEVHALPDRQREERARAVSKKLEHYDGILRLEKKDKQALPSILSCQKPTDDEQKQLHAMLAQADAKLRRTTEPPPPR